MFRVKRGPVAWHVFSRGARQLSLFHEGGDSQKFLALLRESLTSSGCALWAYCLMTNHYHLVLHADTSQISACLRRVNYLYSRYHNEKYHLSGHAFDGPYQAYVIPTALMALYRIAYVFLNPVMAGMTKFAGDWAWSGFKSFMGAAGSPLEVESTAILSSLSGIPVEARERFLRILETEKRLLEVSRSRQGGMKRGDIQARQFEDLLAHAQADGMVGGWTSKELAVWWGHQAGIPATVMGKVMGHADGSPVRHLLGSLKRRIGSDPRLVPELQSS